MNQGATLEIRLAQGKQKFLVIGSSTNVALSVAKCDIVFTLREVFGAGPERYKRKPGCIVTTAFTPVIVIEFK